MIDDQSDPGAWADAMRYLPALATEYRPRISKGPTLARGPQWPPSRDVSSDGGPAGHAPALRMGGKRETEL